MAGTGLGTTFARPGEGRHRSLLVGFEPEEEAPSVFLRLRKGVRKHGTKVFTVAAYASRGVEKLDGVVVQASPGTEAAVLADLGNAGEAGAAARAALGADSIIIVGERLATAPGGYSPALRLALDTGAQLAWIPRRAGDRGALEAGCLPGLLPGGRLVTDPQARVDLQAAWGVDNLPATVGKDLTEILAAAGSLQALVVAGVEIDDLPDPAAALAALEAAPFVVSFEVRNSQVTEYADVVFPVVPPAEKDGTFVNWEGRERPFPVCCRCRPRCRTSARWPRWRRRWTARSGSARRPARSTSTTSSAAGTATARRSRRTRPVRRSARSTPPGWRPGGC